MCGFLVQLQQNHFILGHLRNAMHSDVFAAFIYHVHVKEFLCFCLVFALFSDSVTVEDEKLLRLRRKDDRLVPVECEKVRTSA